MRFIKNSISSWTFTQGNQDSYQDGFPDNTTFQEVYKAAPYTRSGYYLSKIGKNGVAAQLGVYQQLSTRAGGEVISSDSY